MSRVFFKIPTALLTIVLLFVISCVPQQKASSSRRTSGATTGETTPEVTPDTPDLENLGDVSWFSGNSSFENIITLNEDVPTVVYLRGGAINTFLSASLDGVTTNVERTYCMVASYNTAGAQQNLRIRAVPVSFRNLSTNTLERVLRLDFPDTTASSSTCQGSALNIVTTADAGTTVGSSDSAFTGTALCPTCSGIIISTDVSLYLANSGLTVNDRIPEFNLNLGELVLRIDTSSGSIDQGGSCSQSSCTAKGFDCCLDGQCVRDGTLRPNASSQPDFTQALVDVGQNPNNFFNWPNIYFVCGSTPPTPLPTPTPLPDVNGTAAAFLQEQVNDFNCLEEAKNTSPDFAGNSVCAPGFDQASFEAIRSKVWSYCGCVADPFPTDPDDPVCPDFGLTATRDSAGNITEIECFTPPPLLEPTPFQNLSIGVNTRTVPHRFYRADDGSAVDDISTLENTVLPEGTPFQYTDNSSKTGPDCSGDSSGASTAECSFNMNSILGQMSVELNQARPAQVVNLDFDQSYIISTISGFYTPCPTCSADFWFQSFTAYPNSQRGVGLEAVNYITNRSTFQNNSTRGNYADTHFGRACFLPPTMIPFSHKKNLSATTQRQNRILTQSALWVNGYQRDWFGFNKGALIGSFDGVKWFAVGKNRRVTSDTGKLFLAINAPFGDLSDTSDMIVQVILDQGNSISPQFDYDTNLSPEAVDQGSGASCQYWHQCQTDTDCVGKLGWEYMCLDTNNMRSRWPKFNVEAEELADQEFESATFSRILQAGLPSGDRKRCVYRGAGAVCKRNFTNNLATTRQKMFACAPNFHCASLDDAVFNSQVARTPAFIGSINFGLETDVLGRPLNYVEANSSLPETVKENIRYNAELFTTETTDMGVCRPGRNITGTTFINQHQERESSGRADYISQVGVCDSSATGVNRTRACPIIQTNDDEVTPKGDYLLTVDTNRQVQQNSCGLESAVVNGGITSSTFESIEKDPIRSISSIVTPVVARDACLRRAGSVCHTDLDCGPNRLHESIAFSQGQLQFGDTEAEMRYWQEGLNCGQAAEKPLLFSDEYFEYDMGKNRCCREVGKDFTMYTQGAKLSDGLTTDPLNTKLDVVQFPMFGSTTEGRYSRYAGASATDTATTGLSLTDPFAQAPIVDYDSGTIPKPYQWKTVNDTGTSNCCGGGWVRKFSDGTTNWDNPNRLKINPENFSCLNYIQEIPEDDLSTYQVDPINFSREVDRFCLSPVEGGCNQFQFNPPTTDGTLSVPRRLQDFFPDNLTYGFLVASLNTKPFNAPSTGGASGMAALSTLVPYEPIPFLNPTPLDSLNGDGKKHAFIFNQAYGGVSFYLPSYIGYIGGQPVGVTNNMLSVALDYYDDEGNRISIQDITGNETVCTINTNPALDLAPNQYCIVQGAGGTIFHARGTNDLNNNGTPDEADDDFWSFASVEIEFTPQNSFGFIYNLVGTDDSQEGMIRGNELYYLTKLSRFELLGVPQIFYEPIFCNSNRDKLIEGLFTGGIDDRDSFFTNSNSMESTNIAITGRPLAAMYDERFSSPSNLQTAAYDTDGDGGVDTTDRAQDYTTVPGGGVNERFVFNDKVEPTDIFSANEFRCCVKLGEAAPEDAKCCSGNRDSEGLCKLPRGTDLHVYFNKFISGEGVGEDLPGGGLDDEDFIPETGEPKINTTILNKISALGDAFCESGEVTGGGAFGSFFPEPNNGIFQHRETIDTEDTRKYSIVDSARDNDEDNSAGISPFLAGFRWNHHFYCQ
jgi:hypothetical protein